MTDNNECRILINIPADENYIEILGHRIDGFESFEAFLEHLKKYAELEETVKSQKAEIERLKDRLEKLQCSYDCELAYRKELHKRAKAEAVKEFAERFKVRAWVDKTLLGFPYYQITFRTFNNLVKEMVGEH